MSLFVRWRPYFHPPKSYFQMFESSFSNCITTVQILVSTFLTSNGNLTSFSTCAASEYISMEKGRPTTGQEWMWTQADALDKLCLSSALRVIQIFNTALQDHKKICRIRGCKPGQFDILIHPALRAAFNFPTIRCTWRLIWCFVNLLFC